MNKQNIILDFEDLLNTYQNKTPYSAKYLFPIIEGNPITEEYAYLVGKIMGDGHLDHKFTLKFIGRKEDEIVPGRNLALVLDNGYRLFTSPQFKAYLARNRKSPFFRYHGNLSEE